MRKYNYVYFLNFLRDGAQRGCLDRRKRNVKACRARPSVAVDGMARVEGGDAGGGGAWGAATAHSVLGSARPGRGLGCARSTAPARWTRSGAAFERHCGAEGDARATPPKHRTRLSAESRDRSFWSGE